MAAGRALATSLAIGRLLRFASQLSCARTGSVLQSRQRMNGSAHPMRVLLVEDNPDLVTLLVKGLVQGGLAADSVSKVSDARLVMATVKYAAIVLDLGLPDEDGLTLLREMRRKGDATPVL